MRQTDYGTNSLGSKKFNQMQPICPAPVYSQASDLCVLTAYFNPRKYKALLNNYLMFRDSMVRSGIELFTIECAFEGADFELESSDCVLQLRSNSIIWQKERMFNVALGRLGGRYSKFAWIDADLFFTNKDWARDASSLLDQYPVVQLFKRAIKLPSGSRFYTGSGVNCRSVVAVYKENPGLLRGGIYAEHGHTGYAWAATAHALSAGLYDGHILGSCDHLIAHAAIGDWSSGCIDLTFHTDEASRSHFERWARQFYSLTEGRWQCLPEIVLHYWHGERPNHFYRNERLARFGWDPCRDIEINSDGLWEWSTNRPVLHRFVAEYFDQRNDDA